MVSKKSRPIKKRKHEQKAAHEHRPHPSKPDNSGFWKVATLALAVLVIISIFTSGFRGNSIGQSIDSLNRLMSSNLPAESKTAISDAITALEQAEESRVAAIPKDNSADFSGDKVKLEFYIMSQCPYGTQVEDAVKPALDKLGDAVDFSVDFISTDLGGGSFKSLHGDPETEGNKVQLCAIKYEPEKYMDMIVCMNQNAGAIPGNWESCALSNGLDVSKIRTCYEGGEGSRLLSESAARTAAAGATASPTMFINGQKYNGARDTTSFLKALCANLEGHPECAELPACSADSECVAQPGKVGKCMNPATDSAKCEYADPAKVNVIYLNDENCADCARFDTLIPQLQSIFKGLEVTELDYGTAEGAELYDELGLTALPAFLFDSTVEQGEGYANVGPYLEQAGEYQLLRVGATYSPISEICGNGIDDRDQDGLIDCEDDECSSEWTCMDKKAVPEVELFVMSHCPFGTQMEKGMLPVAELLGDKIDFDVKFVYYAMHGQQEVDEQTRQYCIQLEQEEKYLEYLRCFLQAGVTDSCLAQTGIDKAMMDACVEEADAEFEITKNFEDTSAWLSGRYPLFNTHKADNEKYAVGGSPTLVINGVVASVSRDPQSLLDAVCTGFDQKPAECSQQLSGNAYTSGFGFTEQDGTTSATAAAACG